MKTNSQSGKPASRKETTADKKKSEAKTDGVKKDLIEDTSEEKFEGTLRHKSGKEDK